MTTSSTLVDEDYYRYDDRWYEGLAIVALTFVLSFFLVAAALRAAGVSVRDDGMYLPVPASVVEVGENRLLQEQYCLISGAAQGVPFEVVLQECGL